MTRAHWRRLPARAAALLAFSALLVVPALHGSLGHRHDRCAPERVSGCQLAAGDARVAAVSGVGVCPLCLASGQARSLLPSGGAQAIRGDGVSGRAPAPLAPWLAPARPVRSACGPRAPPLPA